MTRAISSILSMTNPLDKVMELYERLLAGEKEKFQLLEK